MGNPFYFLPFAFCLFAFAFLFKKKVGAATVAARECLAWERKTDWGQALPLHFFDNLGCRKT
jgi:hypothetical protein